VVALLSLAPPCARARVALGPLSTGIAQVTGQAGIAYGDPLGGLAALP